MEDYDQDIEEQMLLDWERFEEDKLNREPAKVISIAFHGRELKAVIIEPQKIEDGKDNF